MEKKNLIVLIDNYDSFTYNIYQMVANLLEHEQGMEIRVFRNDEITVEELVNLTPNRLIISPGPGIPGDAGISVATIQAFAGKIPVLGVCLGHQAMAEAFGGKIVPAKNIVHGKVEQVSHDGQGVFRNLPNPCHFTRYHSLSVELDSLPADMEVTAHAPDGEIMGIRHKKWSVEGIQFHPESIGSEWGERLFANFLHWRREPLDRQGLLSRVVAGDSLSYQEAANFMDELTDGVLENAYTAALLTAITIKGPNPDELAGCASVLIQKSRSVTINIPGLLDTCGTGGDGKHTFNISSFSALIAATLGATIAKHGNRSITSRSGSTDFFHAMGIPTEMNPSQVETSIRKNGFAYMAAPLFHAAMRHVAPVRQAMGIKTVMNCLGPLANPAGAEYQLIGVYEESLVTIMAQAAKAIGVKRVLCVHSMDGLDEISPAAPTKMYFIDEKGCETESLFNPQTLGIHGIQTKELMGGDPMENAHIAHLLMKGEGHPAIQEAVCLNAGAALFVSTLAESMEDGYRKAKSALASGEVERKVQSIVIQK